MEQTPSGNSSNNNNNSMLLNRWKELSQERNSASAPGPSSLAAGVEPSPTDSESVHDSDMDIVDSNGSEMPDKNPSICVNKASGHISVIPGSSSTRARHLVPSNEKFNGPGSARPHASASTDQASPHVLPSPVTEQGDEGEEREDVPLVFLGVVFGVVPSQWYSKSLAKWHSGVEALGGRFITPTTDSVPDLVLLPLSDERNDLASPVKTEVPEYWNCPIAMTSWITQCVMAGKLLELHDPDVPILGLDPLAVRLLERRKVRPSPSNQQLSVAGAPVSTPDTNLLNTNILQGLSSQISRMGDSMASQNAAVSAFVDGQGALHSQVKQMASAISTLTEQMHRSHQATTQRIDQLAGLVQHGNRQSQARDLYESSSRVYTAVTEEARRSLPFNHNRDVFVPLPPDRIGAEQRQTQRLPFNHTMPVSGLPPANGVDPRTAAVFTRSGPLSSPREQDSFVNLPDTSSSGHRPTPSQRLGLVTASHHGTAYPAQVSGSRSGTDSGKDAARPGSTAQDGHPDTQSPSQSLATAANSREASGAAAVAQLSPLTTISPSELQALLRNVFSESPKKDHELFWRKARSIYIEHLGKRAPRRVSITHVTEAQAVFPRRYSYDKIIFVSTIPGEDALAILFDMKEKEVVVYDTVDRYRNNLFTFAKEKTLAESFGLKDAAWYVVELVAETEKEDAFPLVCLATKIFATRDRKSFRDLFPPHVVVAKKNIKNPIPPRRQAKADYYWRLVRPRVTSHLVKELSAVLLTRYRHEETQWVDVPKCSEWVEGLTRFEDSEEAKELPDGRSKGDVADGNRPGPRSKKEGGLSVAIVEAAGQQNGHMEPPAGETEAMGSQHRITEGGETTQQQPPATEAAEATVVQLATQLMRHEDVHTNGHQQSAATEPESERPQSKRSADDESPDETASKKPRSDSPPPYSPSAPVEPL